MVLLSQMYLAERMFIRKVFFKREARRRKICPSPILWEHLKVTASPRTAVGFLETKCLTAYGAHSSVRGLLFTIVSNGAMDKFGICFQWPNEHFHPRMLLLSVGNGTMKAPRNLQRRNELSAMGASAMRPVLIHQPLKKQVTPIQMARWILIATYRWNLKLNCEKRLATSRPVTVMSLTFFTVYRLAESPIWRVGDSPILDTQSGDFPVTLTAGSQYSITKISANWNTKSKRH